MKPPVHEQVEARPKESPERLVKRFNRKCRNKKLIDFFKEHCSDCAHYEKPSVKRRLKKARAARQRERDLRRQQKNQRRKK